LYTQSVLSFCVFFFGLYWACWYNVVCVLIILMM
jgi:hypothetical protein